MDIIKVKNESYARYEELLLRRDQLRKEARIAKIEEKGSFKQITLSFESGRKTVKFRKRQRICLQEPAL
ncbi:MAG: hypothetical protein SPL49_09230 [Oribacterium sp.]|nr:hypothetical protein [Oribacterium sp.]